MRYENEYGSIGISNEAIAAIAQSVAQKCFGVRAMAGKSGIEGLVQLFRAEAHAGANVTVRPVEGGGIELDLHIAVNYGVNIPAVCSSIISEVGYNVQKLTGVSVEAVNLYIDAVRQ